MARSRRRINCQPQPAPTVDWLLVDPGFFTNGIAQGSAAAGGATHEGLAGANATRDNLSEVKFHPDVKFNFCFQSRGGTLVLDTGCLEVPDPYGVRPIKLWADVLSTHYQLVLFRICGCSPTGYFVYSFPCAGNAQVVELPNVAPEIWSSSSFGILRHKSESDKFVVANLEIGRKRAFVDMWWHSSSSWSPASGRRESVTLPSNTRINMGEWSTDKVLSCSNFGKSHDVLMFVDLRQGIIVCHNVLKGEEEGQSAVKFEFIRLPSVKRLRAMRRQEMFTTSVGCCNGKLKFASLHISDFSGVVVTIMTFDGRSWHCQQTCSFPPGLGNNMLILCCPVVSANEDNVLYLVLAGVDRKQAWLVAVNTESSEALVHAEYPGFWKHLKPPYSMNLF